MVIVSVINFFMLALFDCESIDNVPFFRLSDRFMHYSQPATIPFPRVNPHIALYVDFIKLNLHKLLRHNDIS